MIPKFILPVCLSATRIAFGSTCMNPVSIVLRHSVAMENTLAIDTTYSFKILPFGKYFVKRWVVVK